MANIAMNKPASIGIRSNDERRNKFVARIAAAEGAVVVAEGDLADDAARIFVAAGSEQETACASLVSLDEKIITAKRATVAALNAVLPAFDVLPVDADVKFAREHRSRIERIVRDIPRGEGRSAAIVKAVREFRLAHESANTPKS